MVPRFDLGPTNGADPCTLTLLAAPPTARPNKLHGRGAADVAADRAAVTAPYPRSVLAGRGRVA